MLMMYLNLVDTPEEKSKFKQLYDKYRNLMFFCAKEILKDDGLAQDAVQEALIKLTKYLKKINEVDCHKTKHFIVIIVESASKDIYRREKRQKSISWEEIGENYDFPQASGSRIGTYRCGEGDHGDARRIPEDLPHEICVGIFQSRDRGAFRDTPECAQTADCKRKEDLAGYP